VSVMPDLAPSHNTRTLPLAASKVSP
jgi:hypothetical protein